MIQWAACAYHLKDREAWIGLRQQFQQQMLPQDRRDLARHRITARIAQRHFQCGGSHRRGLLEEISPPAGGRPGRCRSTGSPCRGPFPIHRRPAPGSETRRRIIPGAAPPITTADSDGKDDEERRPEWAFHAPSLPWAGTPSNHFAGSPTEQESLGLKSGGSGRGWQMRHRAEKSGPGSGKSRPDFADSWPRFRSLWGGFGEAWPGFGKSRPSIGKAWPGFAKLQ